MTFVQKYSAFDAVAAAAAGGNADAIAAAAKLRLLRRDRTASNRTVGLFDFKSAYCTKNGEALSVGKQFRNLVDGAAVATIGGTGGMSYVTNGAGQIVGIRFQNGSGYIDLPDAFKLAGATADFLFTVWLKFNALPTGGNTRSIAGWGDLLGSRAYTLEVRSTNLLGMVVDSSSYRTLINPPVVGDLHQVAIRYTRGVANVVTEPWYKDGVLVATNTGFTDSGGTLNQPAVQPRIGNLPNFANGSGGMDFTVYRAALENLDVTPDRYNPNGTEKGLLGVSNEWAAYSGRFL
ncbi:hypothetical protein NKJ10_17515 [Mesorhizobium sp. M0204]|uniref:hypothetical protein n=1 Tax=Mesorhizobium sp. M0204 TaxID=2956913 RepID=UPI0033371A52